MGRRCATRRVVHGRSTGPGSGGTVQGLRSCLGLWIGAGLGLIATALLRETDLPITEIAFQTGWNSLGTFGRTFRDVLGENPSELRVRERSDPMPPGWAPPCFVSAANRPDLMIAVSEKRRLEAEAMTET